MRQSSIPAKAEVPFPEASDIQAGRAGEGPSASTGALSTLLLDTEYSACSSDAPQKSGKPLSFNYLFQ